MKSQFLHSNWTLRAVGDLQQVPPALAGRDIPAAVPGCVHTDLLAAGLIDDPYLDRNELAVQWIGRTDWRYACRFDLDWAMLAAQRVDLVCEGLDTVARLELNGQALGEAANMHHPHRFDAKPLLRPGANELTITFSSALACAEAMEKRLGPLPHVDRHPFNFIRKMACNFGWDWGPTLVTAGIWQAIRLQAWSGARIDTVRPLVARADEDLAEVKVHVGLEWAAGEPADAIELAAELVGPDGTVVAAGRCVAGPGQRSAVMGLQVHRPQLWWPRGHGDQPLYRLTVLGSSAQAGPAGEWAGRVGLRTVRLNTEPDQAGSKFVLEVNGKGLFCKGADWIPDDCFPHRVDEARYRRRLQQACQANMNMLRVWGGGIYESETFYDLCDELGLMVWQDFLFACAAYPEEEPLRSLVEAEARHNIARLSGHPSLVLWNGCNENIWGYFDWGWKDRIAERTWGLGYYLELLPRLVAELDPTRPYWPGSPYSGSMEIHPLDDRHGNKHVWDAWNSADYSACRLHVPRFVSEFGHQGPPNWPTVRRSIPHGQRVSDSPAMLHHQKSGGPAGHLKLQTRLLEHFDLPESLADWLYLGQLNQARAIATGVEWWRSRRPTCMGTLYWQINDCWPVTSWSAVDGDGRKKLLWYATRRFYADRMLTIQPEGKRLVLLADNDTDQPWRGQVRLRRMSLAGKGLTEKVIRFRVPPRTCKALLRLPRALAQPGDPTAEMIVADADAGGPRATWFFDADKNLRYSPPRFTARLASKGGTHRLTIRARTFIRDLTVLADRLDDEAEVSDQLVTLLPGESFTFEIRSRKRLKLAELTAPPVLQCANRFGWKPGE